MPRTRASVIAPNASMSELQNSPVRRVSDGGQRGHRLPPGGDGAGGRQDRFGQHGAAGLADRVGEAAAPRLGAGIGRGERGEMPDALGEENSRATAAPACT